MRILIGCNRYFPDIAGGGNRVAYDVARYLASQGNEVSLLCEGFPGKPEIAMADEIRILRYTLPGLDIDFFSRHQRAAKRTLKRHLGAWSPDLLWGHMPLQMSAMIDVFPEARKSYTMHSPVAEEMVASATAQDFSLVTRLKSRVLSRIEYKCCQSAAVINVLSQFTKRKIAEMHGEAIAAKALVTPGWADLSRFHLVASQSAIKSELGWPQDRIVFFSVRRFVPRMGLGRLIEAAALLRNAGLQFQVYIVGDGPLRSELEAQINRLRLDDRVRLLGSVSEQQLAAMYSAADASVIPTRALECFGLIAVEAMSAGCPVLSTPVGALPETIAAFEPRWLAKENTAVAIADVMRTFADGKLPCHTPQEIRSFVEENYSQSKRLPEFVKAAMGDLA